MSRTFCHAMGSTPLGVAWFLELWHEFGTSVTQGIFEAIEVLIEDTSISLSCGQPPIEWNFEE